MTVNLHPASTLVSPYGGRLVDLLVSADEARELRAEAVELPSIPLSARTLLDFELLATGALSPLTRFMGEADYRSVCEDMRLADGRLFPLPVTLPVPDTVNPPGTGAVVFCDETREPLAILDIEETFHRDWRQEARQIYGSDDVAHPVIAEMARWGTRLVSGRLRVLRLPTHHDFIDLRLTPKELRARLAPLGRLPVIAFSTHSPLGRVHEEVTRRARRATGGSLLLHPIVGLDRPIDVDPFTRIRGYRRVVERYYDRESVVMAVLPLAERMAGPRETVWHAIIRRNFGASHFIVGHDHAGAGLNSHGLPFFPPDAAAALAMRHGPEIGVDIIASPELVYVPEQDAYLPRDQAPRNAEAASGDRIRRELAAGAPGLPAWMVRPEVAEELARAYPPPGSQGFCVWLTGLSGAGKSTVANILATRLREHGRRVSLLDGDVIRSTLSSELGFSRQDRDTNVRRIGLLAAEVVRHHGAVVCAAMSPFAGARAEVRQMIGSDRFMMVYLDTPIDVCRRRDSKGLYARADRGVVRGLTGVDAPFEPPADAQLSVSTEQLSPDAVVTMILRALEERRFVQPGLS